MNLEKFIICVYWRYHKGSSVHPRRTQPLALWEPHLLNKITLFEIIVIVALVHEDVSETRCVESPGEGRGRTWKRMLADADDCVIGGQQRLVERWPRRRVAEKAVEAFVFFLWWATCVAAQEVEHALVDQYLEENAEMQSKNRCNGTRMSWKEPLWHHHSPPQ